MDSFASGLIVICIGMACLLGLAHAWGYYEDISLPIYISVKPEDFTKYVGKCKKVCSVDDLEFNSVRFAQSSPTSFIMNVGCYCNEGANLKAYDIVVGVE